MYNMMYIPSRGAETSPMSRMIRKQIYIDPAQNTLLKQRARALGVSEAELIRRCLADIGHSAVDIPVDWRAWQD